MLQRSAGTIWNRIWVWGRNLPVTNALEIAVSIGVGNDRFDTVEVLTALTVVDLTINLEFGFMKDSDDLTSKLGLWVAIKYEMEIVKNEKNITAR